MTPFPLKIVTLDGLIYDGTAEQISVRTVSGDMGVLAGHLNCVAPLGMGCATIWIDGEKRYASCIGGMLFVLNGEVKLAPTTFEWAQEIDLPRCETALRRARAVLDDPAADEARKTVAQAHLKRAQVRMSVVERARGK